MINPHRIRYNNIFSNELNIPDLITCVALDSDNGEVSAYLNREAVMSESHDGRYKRIHGFKYTETFAPKFTFIKSNFGDFSMDEVRTVLKWLTSKDTTALLEAYYDDSNVVSWASIGGFIEPQTYKLANNRTIAITATWDSISPFALSDLYTVTKTISDPEDNKIVINIDTDDNKPIYPRVTIQHNGYAVNIPSDVTYSSLVDMAEKNENTAYFNGTTYFWKATEPTWRSNANLPGYAGWTIVTVNGSYNGNDTYEANTIYYYVEDGMYYWTTANGVQSNATIPVYSDWNVVEVNREYTEQDDYADKTFYHYTNGSMYYWIDPYNFHSAPAEEPPNLSTTSVKFVNTHTDLFNRTTVIDSTVVKNNNPNEVVTLDGANKVVSSNSVNRIFDDDFVDWSWLPLLDGKNEITVEGNCAVTIAYREPRKIGEY